MCEWKGRSAFQVKIENIDATVFDYGSFQICAQAQCGLSLFALVESIRGDYRLGPMARYIFITGGVVSSLGKGLASAALGALLQARAYKVRLRTPDPYRNVDPVTMSPYQHGEVVVTDDGA